MPFVMDVWCVCKLFHKHGKHVFGVHPGAAADLHAMDYLYLVYESRLKAIGEGGEQGIEHKIYLVDCLISAIDEGSGITPSYVTGRREWSNDAGLSSSSGIPAEVSSRGPQPQSQPKVDKKSFEQGDKQQWGHGGCRIWRAMWGGRD